MKPESGVLTLGETVVRCRNARFSLQVQTERWVARSFGPVKLPGKWAYGPAHAHAIFELEVDVDDASGSDGEPAPRLLLTIAPAGWRLQAIDHLADSNWQTGPHVRAEGWYGNDAPAIEACSVTFGSWSEQGALDIRWEGQFRWRQDEPWAKFRFEGPAVFSGLHISVKALEDVGTFLAAALPGFGLNGLNAQPVTWRDNGQAMPDASRRRWADHVWTIRKSTTA